MGRFPPSPPDTSTSSPRTELASGPYSGGLGVRATGSANLTVYLGGHGTSEHRGRRRERNEADHRDDEESESHDRPIQGRRDDQAVQAVGDVRDRVVDGDIPDAILQERFRHDGGRKEQQWERREEGNHQGRL